DGGMIHNFGDRTLTFAGLIFLHGTLTVFNDQPPGFDGPAEVQFSGNFRGFGGIVKAGTGVTKFSGTAANTYTGTTTVADGTLVLNKSPGVTAIAGPLVIGNDLGPGFDVVSLAAPNQIADNVAITINSTGSLLMNDFDDKVGSIEGLGGIKLIDPPTLTVGGNDRSTTFAGVIRGPGIVVKVGTGTWTLTGDNTYTGGTTVSDGALIVNGSIVGPVTVDAGATLGGTGTTGPVTLSPGAGLNHGRP